MSRGRASLTKWLYLPVSIFCVREAMARRYFPGQDPIGRRVLVGQREEVWREIVGVVGDVRQTLWQDARYAVRMILRNPRQKLSSR